MHSTHTHTHTHTHSETMWHTHLPHFYSNTSTHTPPPHQHYHEKTHTHTQSETEGHTHTNTVIYKLYIIIKYLLVKSNVSSILEHDSSLSSSDTSSPDWSLSRRRLSSRAPSVAYFLFSERFTVVSLPKSEKLSKTTLLGLLRTDA